MWQHAIIYIILYNLVIKTCYKENWHAKSIY